MKSNQLLWQDNILFYNVAELQCSDAYPGQLLSRFPAGLIAQMDVSFPAQFSRGCELRFWQLPKADPTTINLYAMEGNGQAIVFFGEHYAKEFTLQEGHITPIEISMDPIFYRHLSLDDTTAGLRYPSTLCRVFLNNEAKVCYCGKGTLSEAQIAAFGVSLAPKCHTLQGVPMPFTPLFCEDGSRNVSGAMDVTPPPTSVPPYHAPTPPEGVQSMQAKKKFLAYGSSITHGSSASSNYLSYLQLTAQALGLDVFSFGMSGACTCDNAMADYIAAVPDVEFYYLEIGVNMRHRYYAEEFERRLVYLLQKLQGRRVYITTIYPNRATYLEIENKLSSQDRAYNEIIRKYAPMYGAILLEGADILQTPLWLAHDFIHPSPLGQMKMAENLIDILIQEREI